MKKLLPVAEGERGLRQSDALFMHTKRLPEIVKKLFQTFKPQDYDDMLKLIGYALGSCIGDNQSEKPLAECGFPLSNVPRMSPSFWEYKTPSPFGQAPS